MFTNLIESTSHHHEMARRGRFILATLMGYALLFAGAGVASIYAYDAHLDNQNLDFVVLVAPVDAPVEAQVARANTPRNSAPSPDRENVLPERTEAIAPIADSTKTPHSISATASKVPELPPGTVLIGLKNSDGSGVYNPNLPIGPGGPPSGGSGNGRPLVDVSNLGTPPVTPDPPKPRAPVSKGVITGLATYKPVPPYPPMAIKVRAQGVVNVQILVDEYGKVISARAMSGHLLLRGAAERAAMQTRFSPTKLSGEPVKVSGTITFNFTLS